MNKWNWLILFIISTVSWGCSSDTEQTKTSHDSTPSQTVGNEKRVVCTVNYPLAYFAGRIGGGRVDVKFPAPADIDPAFWNPDVSTINSFQEADLVLLNGATYAKWVAKVSLPPSRVVDTSARFKDRFIHIENAVTHTHGPGGDHAHTGTAFTTWLDFDFAIQHARAILDVYSRKWPDLDNEWKQGYRPLEQDLMGLDSAIKNVVAGGHDLPVVVSHPIYQYMNRRYNLNMRSVMWEPDQFPTEAKWRQLERMLEGFNAGWMIWEGEALPETKARLREMGLESAVFNPCGNRPDTGDFMSVMRQNIENLERVYTPPNGQ